MVLDRIRNLQDYENMGFDGRKILDFIERDQKEHLPEGRYELDGDKLFVLIQNYETKDRGECLYEAHKKYMDIQYMAEGTEMMYAAGIDALSIVEDRTPQADILFYERAEEEAALLVKEGSFALFLPQDGHMPCCRYKEKDRVRKLVFKVFIDIHKE